MRLQKVLAGVLAAALAWNAAPLEARAASGTPVSVRAANIDNTYLEVGLVIDRETKFQSAAVVLTYDAAKLAPITWSGGAIAPGDSWQAAAQLPAKGADATTGKSALVYENGGTGYLFLSAESAKALTVTGENALQATTVRFQYEAEKPDETTTAAIGALKIASAENAAGSPAGRPALFSDGTQNATLTDPQIVYDNKATSVAGGGSGTASTDDFCTVVFYDWDGTLLGSRIVADGGNIAAEDCPKPGYDNETGEQLTFTYEDDTDGDGKGDTQKVFLDDRGGYTFAGWVDYYKGSSTPNTTLTAQAGQTLPTEGDGALVSLSGIKNDMTLKAAYYEDATKMGASLPERMYAVRYSAFRETDSGIETTFTVHRRNNARRANDGLTYLQVILTPAGSDAMMLLLPLDTGDCASANLTVPADAQYLYEADAAVSVTVVNADGNGLSNMLTLRADQMVSD